MCSLTWHPESNKSSKESHNSRCDTSLIIKEKAHAAKSLWLHSIPSEAVSFPVQVSLLLLLTIHRSHRDPSTGQEGTLMILVIICLLS